MQGLVVLIGGISRLIIVIGLVYLFFKLGKFLDALPHVLERKKVEEK
ncbi:MAG: hypothetical protein HXS53_11720 [Theionarchaea archaeon]|nr:hypothetical protein [Theionarchaea archaeon]